MIRVTDLRVPYRLPDSAAIGRELRKTEYLAQRLRDNLGQISGMQFIHALPRSLRDYCAWNLGEGAASRPETCGIGNVLLKSFGAGVGARRGSNRLAATLYGKLFAHGEESRIEMAPINDAGSFVFDGGSIRYRSVLVPVRRDASANSAWLGLIDWSREPAEHNDTDGKLFARHGGFVPFADPHIRTYPPIPH